MPISRRTFVKTAAATTIAATAVARGALKPAAKKKPNVLYVFSDQHRACSLPGEPFNDVMAPNLDAFRRSNFSMDTCITNYPLCTPYRSILMTGRYSCQTGMTLNAGALRTTEVTLGTTFRDAGYHTGYIGKWHLGYDTTFFSPGDPHRHGFEHWQPWGDTNDHYHAPTFSTTGERIHPEGWQPVNMTNEAIDFLKLQKSDKPFFLMLSWNPPHPPFDPPAEDQKPYIGPLKKRPNVQFPGKGAPALRDEAGWHTAFQGYYGAISGVDEQFARILKTLDELGLADNTIISYTADHGEMMASQGRMSKQVPYEESCRVPFSIRYPGVTVKGGKSPALFGAIDIFPTICGLAGVPIPSTCVGRDHSPILRGEKMKPNDIVYLMNGGADSISTMHDNPARAGQKANDGKQGKEGKGRKEGAEGGSMEGKAPIYRGCRTDTHTYAVHTNGRWLLHDNVADPYQTKNLATDPRHKALMDSLDVKIKAWCKFTGDPFVYPDVSTTAPGPADDTSTNAGI